MMNSKVVGLLDVKHNSLLIVNETDFGFLMFVRTFDKIFCSLLHLGIAFNNNNCNDSYSFLKG